jgi:hypothetical protein
MPTVDWAAATDALTAAAKEQFTRFLAGPAATRVYAVGLFYDPDAGDAYPIANTVEHHLREYKAHVSAGNPADELPFLWDSGRWEFPAGLFPTDSPEFLAFDQAWGPFRDEIAASVDPHRSRCFAEASIEALRRLKAEGVFAPATNVMGYVAQSSADAPEEIVANQERVTAAVVKGA